MSKIYGIFEHTENSENFLVFRLESIAVIYTKQIKDLRAIENSKNFQRIGEAERVAGQRRLAL